MQYYINSKRFSNNRFFYQLPVVKQKKDFLEEFMINLKSSHPDYIILPKSQEHILDDSDFSDLSTMLYTCYDTRSFEEGKIFIKKM